MEQIVDGDDENLLSGTVHRHVVVAFRVKEYRQLADHLKAPINLAWDRLARGRKVQRVSFQGQVIFLLSLDPMAREVGAIVHEKALSEAFLDAGGVGRVTTDSYELAFARRLMEKYGKFVV